MGKTAKYGAFTVIKRLSIVILEKVTFASVVKGFTPGMHTNYWVFTVRKKFSVIPGLSDQWPWASIWKMKFSEEQCWYQIEALGYYLAAWATIWQ